MLASAAPLAAQPAVRRARHGSGSAAASAAPQDPGCTPAIALLSSMRAGAAQDPGAEPARCGRKQISEVPKVSGDGLRPEQALRSRGEHQALAHTA